MLSKLTAFFGKLYTSIKDSTTFIFKSFLYDVNGKICTNQNRSDDLRAAENTELERNPIWMLGIFLFVLMKYIAKKNMIELVKVSCA